jgi:anti-sigma factor RsiW
MSRDRRPSDRAPEDAAPPDPDRAAELLAAYVDGVAELPVDERHAVERWLADDAAARADADAVHQLLGQLRALPPDYDGGAPPDWAAMERSIRQAVAAEPQRPWWRRWQWLVPAMTCVATAAVAIALWPRPAAVLAPATPHDRDPAPVHDRDPAPGDDVLALWLDGSEVDVDLAPSSALGDMLGALDGPAAHDAEPDAPEPPEAAVPDAEIGLLPAAGLAWIDDLDDAALDRAERALAASPGTPAPAGPARSKG